MIKGRGVADRRKQQEKIEPKVAISPKVLTEAVMLTATIDALDGKIRGSNRHNRSIFERGYGQLGTRIVQREARRNDGGGRSSTIPAICVI